MMRRGLPLCAVPCLVAITLAFPTGPAQKKTGMATQDPVIERFGKALVTWKSLREPPVRLRAAETFLALCQGSNRPAADTVHAFLDTLLAAVADSRLTEDQAYRLSFDIHEVLHCAFLNEPAFDAVLQDARTQLRSAGVARAEAGKIVERLREMGGQVRDPGRIMDIPFTFR